MDLMNSWAGIEEGKAGRSVCCVMQSVRVLVMCCGIVLNIGSEAWEDYSSGLLSLIKDFVLSVWEERKVRLYGEHANVHQSHSQNDSGDLRGVAGGDGELGCLCGKAGTSHL